MNDVEVTDALVAGAVAAVVSGVPSTVHAIVTRSNPLEATLAAGTLVLPRARSSVLLALAALGVHAALSLGWALALSVLLPRRRSAAIGALAGLGIAALDLGLVGRRFERIRALPAAPQVLDHVAYAATVGAVLEILRRRSDFEASTY